MKESLKVFFGNHKCASTYMISIIERLCRELAWEYKVSYRHKRNNDSIKDKYLFDIHKDLDFFIFPESNIEYIKFLESKDYKGIHIVRDPRDICVSAYFSHLYSHSVHPDSNLGAHRHNLERLNQEEGLIAEFKYSQNNLNNLFSWDYNNNNIFEIRFESMIKNPEETLLEAFDFIGSMDITKVEDSRFLDLKSFLNRIHFKYPFFQPLKFKFEFSSKNRLHSIIRENSFEKKSQGRHRGQEDKHSHYRKGVSGDWKNYFSDRSKTIFKDLYGQGLIDLGYEKDFDW